MPHNSDTVFFFFPQPLPEKFIVRGMVERFNDDFIETRRKALQKFLNRIADHPTLTFNEDFKIFLTAQAWVKNFYFYSYNPLVSICIVGCPLPLLYLYKSGSSVLVSRWIFIHWREREISFRFNPVSNLHINITGILYLSHDYILVSLYS